jgi:hypothetical protein
MSTPREQLAAQIKADNPTFVVWDYPDAPKNVKAGEPVVAVWRSDMDSHPKAPGLALEHKLQINVYGARTAGSAAEAELDNLLDAVMFSLQRLGNLEFKTAARETFNNGTLAGWTITAAGTSKNHYKTEILTGG